MSTAFVLSGGGSLGAVQVGMLQALSQLGVQPDLLVGTSAGAVNALWVAAHGMSPDSLTELARIWRELRRHDIFPIRAGQLRRAFLGSSPSVCRSEPLGELVHRHCGIADLSDATIPVHLAAADLLSGEAVLISAGPPGEAVRASAAIPAVFPPIRLGDRWLVDGALGSPSGVTHAVHLGATEVYVLPTGVPCALSRPPASAMGVAVHALTLLIEQQLIADVTHAPAQATVHLIPPLCPVSVSAIDFDQAASLIERSFRASTTWIEQGGLSRPRPARYLSLHDHRPDQSAAE